MKYHFGIIGGRDAGFSLGCRLAKQDNTITLYEPDPIAYQQLKQTKSQSGVYITDKARILAQTLINVFYLETTDSEIWTRMNSFSEYLQNKSILILTGLFPIGTGDQLQCWFNQKGRNIEVIVCPDFNENGRTVIGGNGSHPTVKEFRRFLADLDMVPIVMTSRREAEMIKLASNALIATKISFVNQLAGLCETHEMDVGFITKAMGLDTRIAQSFLTAGIGFCGKGIPFAVQILQEMVRDHGMTNDQLLEAVMNVNQNQQSWAAAQVRKHIGSLDSKKLAIWGVTYKGSTGSIEGSIAIPLLEQCLEEGATLQIYDPNGLSSLEFHLKHNDIYNRFRKQIDLGHDPIQTAEGADALIILADWQCFAEVNLGILSQILRTPLVIDGRNMFHPAIMEKYRIKYISVGRKVRT